MGPRLHSIEIKYYLLFYQLEYLIGLQKIFTETIFISSCLHHNSRILFISFQMQSYILFSLFTPMLIAQCTFALRLVMTK